MFLYSVSEDTGQLLILSREALSFQLLFAIVPLVMFNASHAKMSDLVTPRWQTVVLYEILKSGGKTEAAKPRTAERFVRLIALFCILDWRVYKMTMINESVRFSVYP